MIILRLNSQLHTTGGIRGYHWGLGGGAPGRNHLNVYKYVYIYISIIHSCIYICIWIYAYVCVHASVYRWGHCMYVP